MVAIRAAQAAQQLRLKKQNKDVVGLSANVIKVVGEGSHAATKT
jgi:hypothetical protein